MNEWLNEGATSNVLFFYVYKESAQAHSMGFSIDTAHTHRSTQQTYLPRYAVCVIGVASSLHWQPLPSLSAFHQANEPKHLHRVDLPLLANFTTATDRETNGERESVREWESERQWECCNIIFGDKFSTSKPHSTLYLTSTLSPSTDTLIPINDVFH